MFLFLLLIICTACTPASDDESGKIVMEAKGEYVYRLQHEYFFIPETPEKIALEPYPWEQNRAGALPKITKEYFRCKGSFLHPVQVIAGKGETKRLQDCGGTDQHSLPLRDNKEFIYPILIDLLNHVQDQTGRRVVITSGHRCPEHHAYADQSQENRYSKHQIGAEVAFYVQGYEDRPEMIVKILQNYYQKEDKNFQRYEKKDTDVSTPPWYNKEIFIKLYKKMEGRDFDNRHPYPYIRILVRYDRDKKEQVTYSWEKSHKNYLRK